MEREILPPFAKAKPRGDPKQGQPKVGSFAGRGPPTGPILSCFENISSIVVSLWSKELQVVSKGR